MRTSHKQIRKRIMEVKSKITDEEFFASKAYRAYLMDITESATRRYKQPLKVFVAADHDDPSLAYEQGYGLHQRLQRNHLEYAQPASSLAEH